MARGIPVRTYSDQELEAMLDDLESDMVERKKSFAGDVPDKVRQAICAFANDLPDHNKPGVLFIGAHDDGTPSGLRVDDTLMRNISGIRAEGKILPFPTLSVEKRLIRGADMVVVTVAPSDMPPVKFDGRIWVRIGSTRSIAAHQDERVLIERRRSKNIPYDICRVPTATISDLAKGVFENEYLPSAFAPDVLETNSRSYEERLASCRMIFSLNDPVPTILGLLSLGKTPQDFIHGAYIQFVRIDGIALADRVIDEEDIGGTIVSMLRRTEEKLAAHNCSAIDIASAPTHIRNILYPPAALQQIVYNAVLHRTYEGTNAPVRVYWFNDRVEIGSPGGPFGNVTSENFGKPGITDYRNPNIGAVLKTFGFVQKFGIGIATARKSMADNGNPPPEFETNQSSIVCTLRKKA
jgi:ATP-dependent DNA helicase RecG